VRAPLVSTFPHSGGVDPVAYYGPQQTLSGGGSSSSSRRWLSDDALSAMLREYSDPVRVGEGLRPALRAVIEANVVAALGAAHRRSKVVSADSIARGMRTFRVAIALPS
jgi:hypothetical protein